MKQQVIDRVRELVPETMDCICYDGTCRCNTKVYAHHLLEAVRRAGVGSHIVTIGDRLECSLYIFDKYDKGYPFFIPLLSPLEDWDRVPGPDGKVMTPEEAERMWTLLAKALGIN